MTEEKRSEDEKTDKKAKKELPEVDEKSVSKQFTGKFGGSKVAYTATAATHVFEIKEPKASFLYVAYTKDDANPVNRPSAWRTTKRGHMMYVHQPLLVALSGHIREFVEETS